MKTTIKIGLFLLLFSALNWAPGHAAICDVDDDGDVDRIDIGLIFEDRNSPSTGPGDPRDADENGTITVLDGRICVMRCSKPNCGTNSPPNADIIGPEEPVCYGETVTVDGSGSNDMDDDPLTFQWVLNEPEGSTTTLSDEAEPTPTFIADVVGRYEVELIVNDGSANSLPMTMTITAQGPTADAGDDQLEAAIGETITLDGSGSVSCSGSALSYSWELICPEGSGAEISDPTAESPTFIADIAGECTATLTVNDGVESTPDTVLIRTESDASLNCGDLVSGSIEVPGEVDEFTFSGQQGDLVTLTLVRTSEWESSATARATVFSPSGEILDSFDANRQRNLSLPENGTYVIRVNAHNLVGTGNYNIGLECIQPETAPVEAALGCGDLSSGAVELTGEVDLFTFTGQPGDLVTLTLVRTSEWASSATARATVFSPSGEILDSFDANRQRNLSLPENGTYAIRVNAHNLVGTGNYNIGLECIQPETAPVEAALGCGDLSSGAVELTGEVDLFTFSGQPGDLVTLTLVKTSDWASGATARATVFSPSGEILDSFDANRQRNLSLPEDGTYAIRVNAHNLVGTGDYNIGLECIQPETAPVEAALGCGDLSSGAVELTGEVDLFTFTGQPADLVTLTLVRTSEWASSATARATVFSPSGAILDSFDANRQRNLSLPEDGTYSIRVNAHNLVGTGNYNIGLECIQPETAPVEAALGCGDLSSGAVELTGEVDLFTFTGQPADLVTLTLVRTSEWASSATARATVFSPSGEILDSFDANRQRNLSLPENGTYVIRVNAHNLVGTGTYNIGLSCGAD